ncbi:MAG TPA: NAD(P)/FAD-dependent oxidoreductase [Pyrinomonadaceae bacterium]|nr:NAD(P)/FAD-dependent oxidoreductase [Pyrinomonadaceae bacterium]
MNKESAIRNLRSAIAIIGGGPAGSSVAIRLARSGLDVTIIEKEKFPRPKLCGEFISPECMRHFEDIGVVHELLGSGGESIRETLFFDRYGRSIVVPSAWFGGNGNALSLSRARMDDLLLQAAKNAGVNVIENATATRVTMRDGIVDELFFRNETGADAAIQANIFIDATGRSSVMRKLVRRTTASSSRKVHRSPHVAFKAHFRAPNVDRNRCEIYSFVGGYGGLSPVEDGLANLCFVVDSATTRLHGGDPETIVREVVCTNPQAATTLKNSETEGEWIAVAIQGFGRNELQPAANVFPVGDAASFIDPFTGSGILMSLESSEVLAKCILAPGASHRLIGAAYEEEYRKRFSARLRLCSILRQAAFQPWLATTAISLLGTSTFAREYLARSTRGGNRNTN